MARESFEPGYRQVAIPITLESLRLNSARRWRFIYPLTWRDGVSPLLCAIQTLDCNNDLTNRRTPDARARHSVVSSPSDLRLESRETVKALCSPERL